MLNIIVEQITSLGDGVLMIGSLAYLLGVRKGKSKYLVLFMLLQYLCAQYLIQLPVQQFILGLADIWLAGGQLENPMRIHEVKKDIARIKTVQREDELKAAKKA